jgi:putative glutamine amidotransferase
MVRLVEGGLLARLNGSSEALVNSIHAQGVDRLAAGLEVEAIAPDGLIEAFRVRDAGSFALALQWHAEWRYAENPLSRAVFAAFGEAARERASGRIDSRATIEETQGGNWQQQEQPE